MKIRCIWKKSITALLLLATTAFPGQYPVGGAGTMSGAVAQKIDNTINAIAQGVEAKGGVIRLQDYIGDTLAPYAKNMPQWLYNSLMTGNMSNLQIIRSDKFSSAELAMYGKSAAMIRATLSMNNSPFNIRILFFEDTKSVSPYMAFSVVLDLPDFLQLSQWFSGLSAMDKVKFQKSKFVFSTAQYRDVELDLMFDSIQLNFIAAVNLANQEVEDFQGLRTFLEKSGNTVPFLQLQTIIPLNPLDTKFNFVVPFNLKKDYAPGSLVTRIAADSLIVSLEPIRLKLGVSMGMFVYVSTQTEPLRFRMGGEISKTELELYGLMEGMYDPAFGLDWLAFGELGLETDFNFQLMAAGIPISGMGFRGKMRFGEPGPKEVVVDLATKFEINTDKIPEIGFLGKINQIDLTGLFALFRKESAKTGKTPDLSDTPVVKFYDLGLKVMPTGMKIAEQTYGKGIQAEGFMDVMGLKGYSYLFIAPGSLTFTLKGALAKIENDYIRITGPGLPGVPGMEEGPSIAMDMSLLNVPPRLPKLSLGVDFELKPLQFKVKSDMALSLSEISASTETSIGTDQGGFGVLFNLVMPFTDMKNFAAEFAFRADFMNALKSKAMAALDAERARVQEKHDNVQNEFNDVQRKVDEFTKKMEEKKAEEIRETEKATADLKIKLRALMEKEFAYDKQVREFRRQKEEYKRICDNKESGWFAACFKVAGKFFEQGFAELKSETMALGQEVLKIQQQIKEAEDKVHNFFRTAISDITNNLQIAENLRNAKRAALDTEKALLDASKMITDAVTALSIDKFSIYVRGEDIARGVIGTATLLYTIKFGGAIVSKRFQFPCDVRKPFNIMGQWIDKMKQDIKEAFGK